MVIAIEGVRVSGIKIGIVRVRRNNGRIIYHTVINVFKFLIRVIAECPIFIDMKTLTAAIFVCFILIGVGSQLLIVSGRRFSRSVDKNSVWRRLLQQPVDELAECWVGTVDGPDALHDRSQANFGKQIYLV